MKSKPPTKDGITIYKANDGWRYREFENGKIIDASTEGYRNRFECIRNLWRKAARTYIDHEQLKLTAKQLDNLRNMRGHCPTITIARSGRKGGL